MNEYLDSIKKTDAEQEDITSTLMMDTDIPIKKLDTTPPEVTASSAERELPKSQETVFLSLPKVIVRRFKLKK